MYLFCERICGVAVEFENWPQEKTEPEGTSQGSHPGVGEKTDR